ncbi:lasso peptide biosynthesis B2 protein [Sphingomonas sp. GB1N7]|uniref:lasso peptide biosynthesis B2 protein n=1 Tax=Parasphingomonas caseinilytica TaxID=3096158 RepID=UPI002FCAEF3D
MARSPSILRKLRTLSGVGAKRQLLVAEAVASMLRARITVLVRPFPKVSARFGTFVPPTDPRVAASGADATSEQVRIAKDIGWAVAAAAPFMPFRSVCLQQAMAAHAMLRRRGIASVMHFGASPGDEKPIDAHAWLDAAGVKVTGYPVAKNMPELGCFV